MDLPFELYKRHKDYTKKSWKKSGLNMDNFEEIYNKYIYATKCELCDKKFEKRQDRHMDHDHNTGEFRNIVCNSCNTRKYDRKQNRNNTSGYTHIYKHKDKKYKQGYKWVFLVSINRKQTKIKSSIDLEKLIKFRDKWFEEHPDYFT